MRTAPRSIILALLLCVGACAQETIRIQLSAGSVEGNSYSNRSLGLSYSFPEGWLVRRATPGPDLPATDASGKAPVTYHDLFTGTPGSSSPHPGSSIGLQLNGVPDPKLRAADAFIAAQLQKPRILSVGGPTLSKALLRPTVALDVQGRPFYRAEYKLVAPGGAVAAYETMVAGYINAHMITLVIDSPTEQGAAELAETVDSFRFAPPESRDDSPAAPIIIEQRPDTVKRIQQSESAARARVRAKVDPEYPAEARDRGVVGEVVVAVIVAADGNVAEASVLSGHPLLNDAALEAVKQWKFEPVLVDGAAVETATTIRVRFRLTSAKQKS